MEKINFDRSKPYYPYIVNYIISLHGLLELSSRAVYSKINTAKKEGVSLQQIIDSEIGEQKDKDFITKIFGEDLEPTIIIGEMALTSQQRGLKLEISIDEITTEFADNYIYILQHKVKTIGYLLIVCYEISKDQYDKSDELWNFFYHVRNAAAHSSFFKITNLKRFPAKWGSLEITPNMNNTPLFKNGSSLGFLGPGDPLYLLYDIEQTF